MLWWSLSQWAVSSRFGLDSSRLRSDALGPLLLSIMGWYGLFEHCHVRDSGTHHHIRNQMCTETGAETVFQKLRCYQQAMTWFRHSVALLLWSTGLIRAHVIIRKEQKQRSQRPKHSLPWGLWSLPIRSQYSGIDWRESVTWFYLHRKFTWCRLTNTSMINCKVCTIRYQLV